MRILVYTHSLMESKTVNLSLLTRYAVESAPRSVGEKWLAEHFNFSWGECSPAGIQRVKAILALFA
jgi:hypothetical protein